MARLPQKPKKPTPIKRTERPPMRVPKRPEREPVRPVGPAEDEKPL